MRISVVIHFCLFSISMAQILDSLMVNLNQIYYKGTQAYYDGKYLEAIPHLEKSLVNWKMRQSIESTCHLKCEDPDVKATRFPVENFDFTDDIEGKYFVHLLERTACLKNCFAEHPFAKMLQTPPITQHVMDEMGKLQAYNYLQILYHEIGSGSKAADAAWTFLQTNPDDNEMRGNLDYYGWRYPEIGRKMKKNKLKNLELSLYNGHFVNGTTAYDNKEYRKCTTNLEEALKGYMKAKKACENTCYKMDVQMERFPQFWRNLADMELKVLRCKLNCKKTVAAEVQNVRYENTIEVILSFLQYCYYQIGDLILAANCVKTQLFINPEDETVTSNDAFYSQKVMASGQQSFQVRARSDVVNYITEQRQMQNLEQFASGFLDYDDEGEVHEAPEEEITQETIDELITSEVERQLSGEKIDVLIENALKEEL